MTNLPKLKKDSETFSCRCFTAEETSRGGRWNASRESEREYKNLVIVIYILVAFHLINFRHEIKK